MSCLIKNSSKSKIITENKFFENTYSRKIIPAKYLEEANAQKKILAKAKFFDSRKLFSPKLTSFKQVLVSLDLG